MLAAQFEDSFGQKELSLFSVWGWDKASTKNWHFQNEYSECILLIDLDFGLTRWCIPRKILS